MIHIPPLTPAEFEVLDAALCGTSPADSPARRSLMAKLERKRCNGCGTRTQVCADLLGPCCDDCDCTP